MIAANAAIIIFLSAVLFSSCNGTAKQEIGPLVVAHRGGSALAPENTLAAFSSALAHGSDTVEMDVHLSNDGVLMVIHDTLLERTTGQQGSVSDYDSNTLATFDAAARYAKNHPFGFQKIPTLAEVIELVENTSQQPVHYQIEIKLKEDGSRYVGIEQKLIDTLQLYGILDRTVAITFDFPTLERLHTLEPELALGALVSKEYMNGFGKAGPKAIATQIASLPVQYVGINHIYLNQKLYGEFRRKGLGVGVWTVDSPSTMKKFVRMGLDFITTNRSDLLRALLSKLQ
ncbi:glycerophosphodiester phosphodiesterase family protein [Sphaerochaeta sp. PS]|uniref:glycerophosphodiester phosphodiesterase n=1 Tax=Sphaerochaeta sp. PS TaxID=3076336 RepID=UPI0028A2ECA8|nr:glycerophosphodiester phosphodiesterase family protein [Sphaerochaeta sp. PS]MDT4761517.1 glycerophosphodiester phosphodiesterase family protein [Sphaerochaeta sp. PS]